MLHEMNENRITRIIHVYNIEEKVKIYVNILRKCSFRLMKILLDCAYGEQGNFSSRLFFFFFFCSTHHRLSKSERRKVQEGKMCAWKWLRTILQRGFHCIS